MTRPRLLILTAVMIEAKAVAAALGVNCPAPGRPTISTSDGLPIELHVIGIAGKGLGDVRPQEMPSIVIMAGLAGGLDPSVKIGDVVIDGKLGELISSSACHRGRIHTTRRLVSTPQDKADLFRMTGALAVDMENDMARQWALGQGAEFIAIRAISDRADQSLDATMLHLVDEWGRPRAGAIVGVLLRRPGLVPQLIRLGRDSKFAAVKLGEAVREFMRRFARAAAGASCGDST
jgi:adenosylhomocysteine nucleosidase